MNNIIKEEPLVFESDKPLGLVLYTDGGARPHNPGYIGWGAHGYLYEINKEVNKPVVVEGSVVTNVGYLTPKVEKETEHSLVDPIFYLDFYGSQFEYGTNNQAEIQGLVKPLAYLSKLNIKKIVIFADSQYVRKGFTEWCENWNKSNWKKQDGTEIANSEWWKYIYQLKQDLQSRLVDMKIDWIQAHSGHLGNVQADYLATIGVNLSRSHQEKNYFGVHEVKKYWKPEIEKHPFINFKRLYFNSVEKYNIAGSYFLADPGGADSVFGKRIPETGLAVIKLFQQDSIIEAVKAYQYEVAHQSNAIILMRLDRVYSPEIYPYMEKYGKYCLLPSSDNLNVNFLDNKPITVEVNPTGLSIRSIESFNFLEELLDDYYALKNEGYQPKNRFIQHDITELFFSITEKAGKIKYELKSEFGVGFRDTLIDIKLPYLGKEKVVKIPLILGTDLLPRNNLKKLETETPKVTLITWNDSDITIRYATIIECVSGVGIWSNFFADKVFLNHDE